MSIRIDKASVITRIFDTLALVTRIQQRTHAKTRKLYYWMQVVSPLYQETKYITKAKRDIYLCFQLSSYCFKCVIRYVFCKLFFPIHLFPLKKKYTCSYSSWCCYVPLEQLELFHHELQSGKKSIHVGEWIIRRYRCYTHYIWHSYVALQTQWKIVNIH